MPIYDQSYRHWEGTLKGRSFRWWVIASRGIGDALRKKRTLLLLWLSLMLFLGCCGFVALTLGYVSKLLPVEINLPLDRLEGYDRWPGFFTFFLQSQTLFVVFITLFAGASLIASDLKGNAIAFYLARPITRLDYVSGKLVVIVFFVLAVTLAPGLVLFGLKAFFSTTWTFFRNYYWIAFSVAAYSLFVALFMGLFMLLFSAMTRSPRDAALKYVGVFFLSDIAAKVLYNMTRSDAVYALSLGRDLRRILKSLFGVAPSGEAPLALAVAVPVLLMALSLWVVFRKVAKAEDVT